jgi:hypothetical protein
MADTLTEAMRSSVINYINVDLDTRKVDLSPTFCIGVFNDKRTTVLRFETDLNHGEEYMYYYDIHIHYRNNNNPVHSVEVVNKETSGDKLRFEWIVDNNAYLEAGIVSFIISFTKGGSNEDDPEYELNTTLTNVVVLPGLEVNPFDVDPTLEVAARDLFDRMQQLADQVTHDSEDITYMYEELRESRDIISAIPEYAERAETAANTAMNATPEGYETFVDNTSSLHLSNVDGALNVTFVKS